MEGYYLALLFWFIGFVSCLCMTKGCFDDDLLTNVVGSLLWPFVATGIGTMFLLTHFMSCEEEE